MAAAPSLPPVPDVAPGETATEKAEYVLAHLDEYKAKWRVEARRARPDMTEAQLEAQEQQAAELFGL